MYNKETDKKWQKYWQENDIYKYNKDAKGEKLYVLEMFSYPSAAKLHLGHWFNFAPVDTYARFKKMNGFNVFHPMGFDAFGLPAENFAIKTGVHPKDSTEKNIENMEVQIKEMGASYDWNYEIKTCDPEYYKWTQWIFSQLYKKGLAYRKKAPVNWCPSCNTVLANEQVIQGACERCGTMVERKKLSQWFFKTTEYAEELLQGLDTLNWPELTKKIQKNWIGKSQGAEILFKVKDKDIQISVFTTRPDTLYGVSYLSVAPESELAQKIITSENAKVAEEYIKEVSLKSELERQFTDREKTGVFTGSYAICPITNNEIPIYLADYVLENYGNGAVMGVPAHDTRDFEFAKKYNLEIKQVIQVEGENTLPITTKEKAKVIDSGEITGLDIQSATKKIIEILEAKGLGKAKTEYKLKDWLVSRQRYWGAPIPIIHCDCCGEVLVEDKDLPVLLPYNVEFKPDGKSPLAKCEEFMNVKCPKCGKPARREADTLDTFVCSSWYQLRYPFNKLESAAFDKEKINDFSPVDVYVGGKEHAAMHLIYTRFIYKVLRDLGFVKGDEPFKRLIHQGLILGPDGNKMSKSKGNVVAPDKYVDKFGSDVLRVYMMFAFAFEEGGPWNEEGINAINKYFVRVQNLKNRIFDENINSVKEISKKDLEALNYVIHSSIGQIEKDVERFSFNTAIAKLMEITNEMIRIENTYGNIQELKEVFATFILLLAPFAPHLAEEMWHDMGNKTSVHLEKYPEVDKTKAIKNTVVIAVSVNGKLRDTIEVERDLQKEEILKIAKSCENVDKHISGKEILKEIYVPNKIVNIVVK